jgi:uncharacterized membrane protein YfcA
MEISLQTEFILGVAIFFVALLYSSVGHAGASGYLAIMALAGIASPISRTTALILNIFVALIASFQFYRAKRFDWKIFLPFAVVSVPFAFIGGMISLPTDLYKKVLGAVLLIAAARLLFSFAETRKIVEPSNWLAAFLGAIIGFISGLTGVGGGIFLTPILFLTNWTDAKTAAGVSALFILVNSIAGLIGSATQIRELDPTVWIWIVVALAGGAIGSRLGSNRFDSIALLRILSAVLVIAGIKLLLT